MNRSTSTSAFAPIALVVASMLAVACGPLGQHAADGGRPDGRVIEEICDNGLDDDGNGQVDETCACLTGATQRCFVGNPALAGVGPCTWGRQRCVGNVELGTWTACTGYGTATMCSDPGGGDSTRRDGGSYGGDDGGARRDGYNSGGDDGGAGRDGSGGGDYTRRDGGNSGGDDGGFFWRPDSGSSGGDDGGHSWWPDSGSGGGDDGGFFWRPDSGSGGGDDGGGTSPRDSGVGRDSGGGDDGGRRCTCIPGQARWCDTPTACSWGRQTCLPDGRWGTCSETTLRPAGCTGYFYSRNCCVAAGQCCQNYPYNQDSVGNCGSVLMCTP